MFLSPKLSKSTIIKRQSSHAIPILPAKKILSYYCDEFWALTLPSGTNVKPLDQVLSVEVLPLARSAVSRAIVENLSFSPALRADLTKPNGNYLIELHPNQAIINYQVETIPKRPARGCRNQYFCYETLRLGCLLSAARIK